MQMLSADSGCPFCNRAARVEDVTVIPWAELKVNKARILGAGIPRRKVWARSCRHAEQRNRTYACLPNTIKYRIASGSGGSPKLHWARVTLLFNLLTL